MFLFCLFLFPILFCSAAIYRYLHFPHVSCNHFFHFCPFKALENTTPTAENFGSFFGIVVKYRNKRLSPSGSDHSKRLVLIGDWFCLKLLSFVFVLCFVLISYFLCSSWFLSFPSVLCRFLSLCLPFFLFFPLLFSSFR